MVLDSRVSMNNTGIDIDPGQKVVPSSTAVLFQ